MKSNALRSPNQFKPRELQVIVFLREPIRRRKLPHALQAADHCPSNLLGRCHQDIVHIKRDDTNTLSIPELRPVSMFNETLTRARALQNIPEIGILIHFLKPQSAIAVCNT